MVPRAMPGNGLNFAGEPLLSPGRFPSYSAFFVGVTLARQTFLPKQHEKAGKTGQSANRTGRGALIAAVGGSGRIRAGEGMGGSRRTGRQRVAAVILWWDGQAGDMANAERISTLREWGGSSGFL